MVGTADDAVPTNLEAKTFGLLLKFAFFTGAVLITISGCTVAGPPYSLSSRIESLKDGEALAFSYFDLMHGLPDIYLLDQEHRIRTTGVREKYDTAPLWSPDGSQILYQQSYGWETDLFLLDVEAWETRPITEDGFYKHLPRWSPGGERLAYLVVSEPGDPSGKAVSLTIFDMQNGERRTIDFEQLWDYRWRPDGQSIVTLTRTGEQTALEAISLDGRLQTQDVDLDFLNGATAVFLSPNASLVAYAITDPDPNALADLLYVAVPGDSERVKVGTFAIDSSLAWSPDSTRLAWVSLDEDSNYALFVVNADGSKYRKLLVLDAADDSGEILPGSPAWSSDSTKIAIGSFSSPEGSTIYILNANSGNTRQVADSSGFIYDLSWRP